MRLIDADKLNLLLGISDRDIYAKYMLDKMPTIDAVPVVRCEKCVLHGNCVTEDAFVLAGIENPFCCAGKTKEGADND